MILFRMKQSLVMTSLMILFRTRQLLLMTEILSGRTNKLKHLLRRKNALYKSLKRKVLNSKFLDKLDPQQV